MIALLATLFLVLLASAHPQGAPTNEIELNRGGNYVEKLVQYRADPSTDPNRTVLEGLLIYNKRYNKRNKAPAVIVFHAFLGRTAFENMRGRDLAKLGYVVFVADTYGKNVSAPDVNGYFGIMGGLLAARTTILRGRILAAWNQINTYNFVDKSRIGSIGYCFGGLCTLDLARFNVGLVAAVSFHGTLTNYPSNQNASHITASIQAHHPDLDVYTTEADADVFLAEMKARKADWWWLRYSNAHHAFTYHDRQLKMLTIFVSLISSIMLLFCTVNCKGGKNKVDQIMNCNFLKNEYAKICFTFPPLAVFTETKAFCEAFVVSCEAELKANIFTNLKKRKHKISEWEREQLRRLEEYDRQKEEYEAERKRTNDRMFDEYNARMKEYAIKVHIQRYKALLEQQAKDRAKLAKSISDFGTNIRELCSAYTNTVRLHCKGRNTPKEFIPRCGAYFRDCHSYLPRSDPLYDVAHSFSSGVGLNLGSWEVKGVPYYPINEEGAFGAGHYMNIPFGSWGGGYQQNLGVRDYWSQTTEIGANWYDGKYGYKGGWSVPLVQSLGVEGDIHSVVSVPTKPQDRGKPIGVDVGGGVGPYYQQNTHVGVDPWNGGVQTGFGVGVPLAGVGVNTGLGIQFPGANTFLGK
ncbi:hypothetical protein WR25_00060 [Diploscapter pachys]|uniref:Dienelactone hydrolase domain-containing protein n=1 Tax=Diploscapter pachys TaxID=2018661 RepID=A0A2A2KEA4_9BILA|nr:hypothetical protein WR25_00060 [Diploscapter pachys]